MEIRNITKSSWFAVTAFFLVAALLPFAVEQIGEITGMFRFPAAKWVKRLFSSEGGRAPSAAAEPVDWEQYRRDLEVFSAWVAIRGCAAIHLPPVEVEIPVVADFEPDRVRKLWPVPVTGCTPGDPAGEEKGYVYMSGVSRPFAEGSVIEPSEDRCGYEIVCVGERSVWFRALFGGEGDSRMGVVRLPDFTRVSDGAIVRGGRKYVARDAFPLVSGGCLAVDSFMPPECAVFKLLDGDGVAIATILCVVIEEKGGAR